MCGPKHTGISVVLEPERSRRSLAGQQGYRPTATPPPALCSKLCTPRGRMELCRRACCNHPLRVTQTICACQLPVFPSSHTGWSRSLPLGRWRISSGMMWTARRGGRQIESSQAVTVALEQHCYISNSKKTILQILHPVLCLIIGLN